MRLVHTDVPYFMIGIINDRDLILLLEHQHSIIRRKDIRDRLGPTLAARNRSGAAGQLGFTVLLHGFCRVGFQDWIGVITNQPVRVAHKHDICAGRERPIGAKYLSPTRLVKHGARA
jgi:hypothetical protein